MLPRHQRIETEVRRVLRNTAVFFILHFKPPELCVPYFSGLHRHFRKIGSGKFLPEREVAFGGSVFDSCGIIVYVQHQFKAGLFVPLCVLIVCICQCLGSRNVLIITLKRH